MTDMSPPPTSMPRVLVVLPMYGGSLPIGRYCAAGLRQLGHQVELFEAPGFYSAFGALKTLKVGAHRLEHLESGFLQLVSQAVLAKVESFEPDLVLAMAQAPLTRQALTRLRRDGVATAMWFVEDYQVFTYWRGFAPLYDVFAVIQKEPFLGELERAGVEHGVYLPLAAEPSFHRPLELTPAERKTFGSDLSFLGAGYPNRRRVFQRLLNYDFKIWGSDWDGDEVLAGILQRNGARIEPEEAVKIFNASKINLNLHSSIADREVVATGDFVNPRTFEVACCGGFQLTDRRSLLGELFGEDEMAMFTSVHDLREKIGYFLSRPEERAEFAVRSRKRVLQEHTYALRMQHLMEFLQSRRPGWPAPRAGTSLLSVLPEGLQEEVATLLSRLGLSGETGFEDLVQAVRQQHSELTTLEASLLFLDEWRKHYKRH